MSEKIKNWLLYAGFDKEKYRSVLPAIQHTNRILTISISGFATILIAAMYVSALFVEGVKSNKSVYFIGMIVSFILFINSVAFSKKHDVLITPLMMASCSIFYIYGILIGTMTSPDEKTVTFIVMLVYLPTLFIDRPLHMALLTVFYDVVFICLCYQTKTGGVLGNDVADALVFGILGISSGIIITHMKVRGYVKTREAEVKGEELERKNKELADANRRLAEMNQRLEEVNKKLEHINRTDSLTKLQNRAAYDADIVTMKDDVPEHCLGCIYIDADGLKKINDTGGHQAGNMLLQTVAEEILNEFGKDLSYRIGGDEFVVFVPDPKEYEISTRVDRMAEKIEDKGYHISAGWKIHQKDKLSMLALEREAEAWMYQKKAEFHRLHPELSRDDNASAENE